MSKRHYDEYMDVAKRRGASLSSRATKKQVEFLETLLNDCGFGTRDQRNLYLSQETAREIKFVDELTFEEARGLIDKLLKERTRRRSNIGFSNV